MCSQRIRSKRSCFTVPVHVTILELDDTAPYFTQNISILNFKIEENEGSDFFAQTLTQRIVVDDKDSVKKYFFELT